MRAGRGPLLITHFYEYFYQYPDNGAKCSCPIPPQGPAIEYYIYRLHANFEGRLRLQSCLSFSLSTGGPYITTADLFRFVHLGDPSSANPTPGPVKSCSLVTHTPIGEWAVCLRLKGLLHVLAAALNRRGICAVSVDSHLMKQNLHACVFRGTSKMTFKANSTFLKDHVAKDRAHRSHQTQVSDLSVVEGEEALEGTLDLWAMCMRYPCVDIPVWFDPPGVMGAGSSNLDRSNLNTCVVDSSDD